ncbi:hypothetical protein DUNSADRAFT_15710 [Dunaliella salina]|uniref:CBM20 domain-containing protein n=1 Tax=Dunaliella salina TaxID=3046 RepID=A0ABQ7G4W0_DUNSA|nr:hypothetical protein DUNSADRAFT_15710 [Dunaliella salina]|eukprot:KAF5829626.1 hypothetical protein DUNSADRAFT_15710 [Dunaliella salina]
MNLSAKALSGLVSAPTVAAFPRPPFATPGRTVGLSGCSSSRLQLGSTAARKTVLTRFKPEDESSKEVEQATEKPEEKVSHPTLFTLKHHCAYGQQWRVCGNVPELGKWDPSAALPMLWGPDDVWFALVDLPEGEHIEYKHVLFDEHTDKCFWVHDGMTTNMALEVLPNERVTFGPSTAVVGGPDVPDVRQMEADLEAKRAAAMCTVEVHRVAEETPAVESLPFGKSVEQEFTEFSQESQETGPRGPVGPVPQVQPEEGYVPPTDVPASVEAVPPGEVLAEAVPAIPGVTYATKDTLPTELGIVGTEEADSYAHGSFEIVNEMPISLNVGPPSSLRTSCHTCGGVPPPESFREQVQAAKEAAGLTEAAKEQGDKKHAKCLLCCTKEIST